MQKLLLIALVFTGFEFQETSARNSIGIKDCWDGNKCNLDKHCGEKGKCISSTLDSRNIAGLVVEPVHTGRFDSFLKIITRTLGSVVVIKN
jgi:hypothetical protein